ncbi:MAG: hypothetical protein FWG98_06400 [Candidatus Cloacimonetes bacterium]|nr:hypothetical protein [Candidatus Cloacimonadota bacterium]
MKNYNRQNIATDVKKTANCRFSRMRESTTRLYGHSSRMTLVLVIIFLMALTTGLFAQTQPPGDGTEASPYLIETTDHLHWLTETATTAAWGIYHQNEAQRTTVYYRQIADIDFDGVDTTNWNAGEGFLPIGRYIDSVNLIYFHGVYDGNGKKISKLIIAPSVNQHQSQNTGFFGLILGSEIKNLIFEDISVTGSPITDENLTLGRTGGAVGSAQYGSKLINISVSGNITASASGGGIAGQLLSSSEIEKCNSSANVSTTYQQTALIGGLVGILENSKVIDSFNTGDVSYASNDLLTYVGGIAGQMDRSTIENCFSSGNLTGAVVGGIAGIILDNNSTIKNIYSSGNLTAFHINYASVAGGIVGGIQGIDHRIENSYTLAQLSGTVMGRIFATMNPGNIVIIQDCFWLNDGLDPTTAFAEGNPTIIGDTGPKSSFELNDTDTFSSWVFFDEDPASAWKMSPHINSGFPYLSIFYDELGDPLPSVPESMIFEPPLNLTLTSINSQEHPLFTWSTPQNGSPLGYKVYRDGEVVESFTTALTFTDAFNFVYGPTHTYHVVAVYENDIDSGLSNACDFIVGKPFGSGMAADPFLISFANNLLWLSANHQNHPNAYYEQTNDIDFTGLDPFTPIGRSSQAFKGVYDGQNHKIIGLKIEYLSTNYFGLFGYISESTLKNIRLDGFIMDVAFPSTVNYTDMGAIVGLVNSSQLINCHVENGDIKVSGTISYLSSVGGLAGSLQGNPISSITECSFSGNIEKSVLNTAPNGTSIVAGLVGDTTNAPISNSHFSGNIIVDISGSTADRIAAGIIGRTAYTTISDVTVSGTITSNNASIIGGIAGYLRTSIINDSKAVVNISGITSVSGSAIYGGIGGICGEASWLNSETNNSTIRNSSFTGNINNVSTNTNTGGIIAFVESTIIDNCFAIGVISGPNSGGLVGRLLSNSSISNSYSVGNIFGGAYSGGIAATSNGGNISDNYSWGEIFATNVPAGIVAIPNNNSQISRNFWNGDVNSINAIGYDPGGNTVSNNFARTTEQMKDIMTFFDVGWNFDTIWTMQETLNDGFPFLGTNLPEGVEYAYWRPGNFAGNIAGETVELMWDAPHNVNRGDLTGYIIYRDNELLATLSSIETSYVDDDLLLGRGIYEVRAVYVGDLLSVPSRFEIPFIEDISVLNFGFVALNEISSPLFINLINLFYPDDVSVNINVEGVDADKFSISSTGGNLGDVFTFSATLTPDSIRLFSAELVITYTDDPTFERRVSMFGRGHTSSALLEIYSDDFTDEFEIDFVINPTEPMEFFVENLDSEAILIRLHLENDQGHFTFEVINAIQEPGGNGYEIYRLLPGIEVTIKVSFTPKKYGFFTSGLVLGIYDESRARWQGEGSPIRIRSRNN